MELYFLFQVSLTEYLSRKRTTGSVVKRDAATPVLLSSNITSAALSRFSDTGNVLGSSDPPTSVLNYRGNSSTSNGISGYVSTATVSSSTIGIEPVSPEEGYGLGDDKPSLSNNVHG